LAPGVTPAGNSVHGMLLLTKRAEPSVVIEPGRRLGTDGLMEARLLHALNAFFSIVARDVTDSRSTNVRGYAYSNAIASMIVTVGGNLSTSSLLHAKQN
jgi:hypothetical protein